MLFEGGKTLSLSRWLEWRWMLYSTDSLSPRRSTCDRKWNINYSWNFNKPCSRFNFPRKHQFAIFQCSLFFSMNIWAFLFCVNYGFSCISILFAKCQMQMEKYELEEFRYLSNCKVKLHSASIVARWRRRLRPPRRPFHDDSLPKTQFHSKNYDRQIKTGFN